MHVMGIRLAALLIARWTNLGPAVIIKRYALLLFLDVCLLTTREKQVVLNGCLFWAGVKLQVASCKRNEEVKVVAAKRFYVLSLFLTFPIKIRDGSD